MRLPRILVAAGSSGSGKTTFMCALLHHFQVNKINAVAFKCGPDYIDPMFHRAVSGVACVNIDPFFLHSDAGKAQELLAGYGAGGDIAVIEGVMGLFDGTGEACDYSTAAVAAMTATPVIAVINAKGSSSTALAVAEGIVNYRSDVRVAGVIFNNMSEKTYRAVVREHSLRTGGGGREYKLLGYIPVLPEELKIASRHLGLIAPDNALKLRGVTEQIYARVKDTVDWSAILDIAREAESICEKHAVADTLDVKDYKSEKKSGNGTVIAVARDEAFNFYYEENIRALRDAGAEIVYFSPLNNEPVPKEACGIYIGGGYPELHVNELSRNSVTKESVRAACERHMPVIAECGGYMYLLKAVDGYEMCGVIPKEAYNTGHLVRFGYVTVGAAVDTMLLGAGESVRGHEFHYYDTKDCQGSTSVLDGAEDVMEAVNLRGESYTCAYAADWIYAGYPHIYMDSAKGLAERFVSRCEEYKKEVRSV